MACPVCMCCGRCGKKFELKRQLPKGVCFYCGFDSGPDASVCAQCGAALPLPPGKAMGTMRDATPRR